jgi:hypothetical protein
MSILSDSPPIADAALQPRTLVILPGEGKTLRAYGDTAQVKLSGEQTNGSMSVALSTTPPGGGPPPHRHHNEDEMFLVLEGSIRYLAPTSSRRRARAGRLIWRGFWQSATSTGSSSFHHWPHRNRTDGSRQAPASGTLRTG